MTEYSYSKGNTNIGIVQGTSLSDYEKGLNKDKTIYYVYIGIT